MIELNHKSAFDSPKCNKNRRGVTAFSAVVGILICVFGIWLFHAALTLHARTVAIEEIEQCGGTVTYDYQWSPEKAWIPDAVPPGPLWVRRILGQNFAANVVEVQLSTGLNQTPEKFTDVQAVHLASLKKVQWLVLTDTSITDSGLKCLSGLKDLERLDLERTMVTEAGVQALHQALPKVKIYYDDGLVAPE